jgi:hypothetical protein
MSELELPTNEEHSAALLALEEGDFAPMESYLERSVAWYLDASKSNFDREKFIAGMKSEGKAPDEAMIRGAQKLSHDILAPLRRDSAEHAYLLARLLVLQGKLDSALPYLEITVEQEPDNADYSSLLDKTRLEIKNRAAA